MARVRVQFSVGRVGSGKLEPCALCAIVTNVELVFNGKTLENVSVTSVLKETKCGLRAGDWMGWGREGGRIAWMTDVGSGERLGKGAGDGVTG